MNDHQGNGSLTGFLVGAAVGAGLALLWAPASGAETRRRLKQKSEQFRSEAARSIESMRARSKGLQEDVQGKLNQVGESVREGAQDLEAAVNEGFGAFQHAARQQDASKSRRP